MDKFIAVIDYGLGNLRSVSKAIEKAGAKVKVTSEPADIKEASALVLPGVGAFKSAMDNLTRLNLTEPIKAAISEDKPFLGICLGLQVLFSESEEHGSSKGLDIIKGKVKKFTNTVKIPHMGWNDIKFASSRVGELTCFKNIPDGSYFYFVHSYYVDPQDTSVIVATTEYGKEFTSAINKGNLWGVQFHPEKSEKLGLKILENFCNNVN